MGKNNMAGVCFFFTFIPYPSIQNNSIACLSKSIFMMIKRFCFKKNHFLVQAPSSINHRTQNPQTHTKTHQCMHAWACTHTHTHTHTPKPTCSNIHTRTHAYTWTHKHACTHTYTHTWTYTHTRTHTHTHKHTHEQTSIHTYTTPSPLKPTCSNTQHRMAQRWLSSYAHHSRILRYTACTGFRWPAQGLGWTSLGDRTASWSPFPLDSRTQQGKAPAFHHLCRTAQPGRCRTGRSAWCWRRFQRCRVWAPLYQ